ncbi:glycine--tRNA ligase subunit beta [bacterium]|nr:glycine--tRNA ligase subunit beta [bacterium]
MAKPLNFQQLILRLHQFWAERGCLIWQPYSEKVGAGTMNPATVISVLGPEPWSVAYAEPSYRPDDGRFGENPNRMQMHTQYQVILKPDPGNPQEIYLDSLRAIGIDVDQHDIRFVEDNWESPALGAWGLGWEVWLDGMEITQFTYFQQAASQVLDMPAVEITYGLERIAIFLQGVRKVWDLHWNDDMTYGEVLLQPEIDHCKYDFEVANVERLHKLYELFEEEARSCLAADLVVPAHDAVLRCSHTFNVLDARGAIGVTERAAYFAKMRDMAKQVGQTYVAQREAKGFPLLAKLPAAQVPVLAALPEVKEAAAFVFELGVEELPPDELQSALEQWRTLLPKQLDELRLEYSDLRVDGTPRRLVVRIGKLAAGQADREVELKGPPAQRAYDEAGNLTQVGLGFAKSQGLDPAQLQVRTEGNKSYLVAQKLEAGQGAAQLLSEAVPRWISALRFRKTMRWDRSGAAFSRPVRWLLCLHGSQVIPCVWGHLHSGRQSRAPRPLDSVLAEISNAQDYSALLESWGVLLERDGRKARVAQLVQQTAATIGGQVPDEPDLLDEVTDLIEVPVPVLGAFEEERLSLPAPVLTTVMKKHQRYFPVLNAQGQLMPNFITVSNGQRGDLSLVRRGNEDVLRARYADAQFFVADDLQQPLESYLPRLATLTFQEKLGSMLDKSQRVEKLVTVAGPQLGVTAEQLVLAGQAARLCKADLVTSMVIEMTSLQGVLGEIYAVRGGTAPEVALALREHYLPRHAGDATPGGSLGRLVGLCDRIDSLAGLFSIGLKPTGSADPYGLRRTALGLVALLVEGELSLDLRPLLQEALSLQPIPCDADKVLREILHFVADRLLIWLKDKGLRHDVVEAAVSVRSHDPFGAWQSANALQQGVQEANWASLLDGYSRCAKILPKDLPVQPLRPDLYREPAVQALHRAIEGLQSGQDAAVLVQHLGHLQPIIDKFFLDVMVNDSDEVIRSARQALMQRVAGLAQGIADLSRLEGY